MSVFDSRPPRQPEETPRPGPSHPRPQRPVEPRRPTGPVAPPRPTPPGRIALSPPAPSHAGHMPPARQDPMEARSLSFPAVARTGGPGFTLPPIPATPSFGNG